MGIEAAAASSPKCLSAAASTAAGFSHRSPSSNTPSRKRSASAALTGVGAAEPMPVPTWRRSGSRAMAKEQTAITIAFRVPTLLNCCGPFAGATRKAAIRSSFLIAFRLGPVKNSRAGSRRVPAVEASSTTASLASSGGWASPAGEADPRLPPTVPRCLICGDPTVRDAIARPGSWPPSSAMIRAYVTPAPMRSTSPSVPHSPSSPMRVRSIIDSGRWRSRLISTITSVPPAIGIAAGDGSLDQPVRPVGGIEDLVLVVQPEGRQVDDVVMLVLNRQPDLGNLRTRRQGRFAHRVQRLLQRQAVLGGKRLDQLLARAGERLSPVQVVLAVAPPRDDRSCEHPVVGFGKRRVLVSRVAEELGPGGFQKH